MLCFDVKRNGARLYTAGIRGKCVLSAIVTHVDVVDPGPKPRRMLDFLVSGLNSDTKQHMNWRRVDLKTGDRIEIRVIESDKADSPAHITKSPARKAVVADALARIRARRKALLGELRNLQRDELAYSREAEPPQTPRKKIRRLAK